MIEVTASRRTCTNDSTSYSRNPSTSRLMTPAGVVEVLSFFRPYAARSRLGFVIEATHPPRVHRTPNRIALPAKSAILQGRILAVAISSLSQPRQIPHRNRAEVTSPLHQCQA